jgi:hypothetical protein
MKMCSFGGHATLSHQRGVMVELSMPDAGLIYDMFWLTDE